LWAGFARPIRNLIPEILVPARYFFSPSPRRIYGFRTPPPFRLPNKLFVFQVSTLAQATFRTVFFFPMPPVDGPQKEMGGKPPFLFFSCLSVLKKYICQVPKAEGPPGNSATFVVRKTPPLENSMGGGGGARMHGAFRDRLAAHFRAGPPEDLLHIEPGHPSYPPCCAPRFSGGWNRPFPDWGRFRKITERRSTTPFGTTPRRPPGPRQGTRARSGKLGSPACPSDD